MSSESERRSAERADPVRSGVEAHNHAMEIPIRQVVEELVAYLGATTVAAIAGVKETRAVQQWMADREPQRPHVLRFALQLVTMVARQNEPALARAWFHGSNPALGDQTPIVLFRSRPLDDIAGDLMSAARAFAARENQSA
jgi:hypothetical protein